MGFLLKFNRSTSLITLFLLTVFISIVKIKIMLMNVIPYRELRCLMKLKNISDIMAQMLIWLTVSYKTTSEKAEVNIIGLEKASIFS